MKIALNRNVFLPALAFALIALIASAMWYSKADAQPSQFPSGSVTSVLGTTSPQYMTPGTATTTIVYDSFQICGTNQNNGGNTWATDSATLLLDVNASSTGTRFNVNLEYSQDCVNWYSDASTNVNGFATTTTAVSLQLVPQYQYGFIASSTVGGIASSSNLGVAGLNNRDTRAVTIQTPVRAVRAVITVPLGASNGSVWAQIVPKKEQSSR